MSYAINLDKITIDEYRALMGSRMHDPSQDGTLAKAAGMTVEEVRALSYQEYRKLVRDLVKATQEPLSDPN
jgi:hypothetical protein